MLDAGVDANDIDVPKETALQKYTLGSHVFLKNSRVAAFKNRDSAVRIAI